VWRASGPIILLWGVRYSIFWDLVSRKRDDETQGINPNSFPDVFLSPEDAFSERSVSGVVDALGVFDSWVIDRGSCLGERCSSSEYEK
jgi:hypothetical protein